MIEAPTRIRVVTRSTTDSAAPNWKSRIAAYCWKISIDVTFWRPPLRMLGVT
jgi:hypothetical protein